MSELLGIARFTFHEGRVEEWKRLTARCMEIVQTQDTGTLQYDIYLSDDESSAVVVERYRDSAALREHLEHIGDELMAAIMTTATIEGETLGDVDDRMRAQMEGTPVRLLAPYLSM